MKLATERIGADQTKIDIEVDGSGNFNATFEDQDYSAATRKELLEKLTAAVRKARAQGLVDVTVIGLISRKRTGMYDHDGPFEPGAGVVNAKLRGKHERSHGVYLLVSDDGKKKKFQTSGYQRDQVTIARRMTLAEATKYLQLREAVRVAEVALEDFVGSVKIDPDDALEAARKK